jgi:tRNA pseudouridine13 synthase
MQTYLTHDFDGIGGVIRQRPEDFFVQEIPLYEPVGVGEHVFAEIQKVGLTTFDAINRIARECSISPRDIGFAGMKDKDAVTRQVVSVPGVSEEQLMKLQSPELSVLWATRHRNKLKLGHLKGNRFAIRIREVEPSSVVRLQAPLKLLQQRGMPNFFGEQRFGIRHDNDQLGAALIRGDNSRVLHLLLGSPRAEVDPPEIVQARTHFDRGEFDESLRHWPRRCGMERRLVARFAKTRRPGATVRGIEPRLRRLWISALQSRVFNEVLRRRIDTLDRILPGEVCEKLDNHACFRAEDPAVEQARADRWEISPTGPLLGYRLTLPTDEALAIEQSVFDQFELKPADFRNAEKDRAKGDRRALRVRPEDVRLEAGVDENGGYVLVAFTLPAGSFATVLLRELMKPERHGKDDASAVEPTEGDDSLDETSPSTSEEERSDGDGDDRETLLAD